MQKLSLQLLLLGLPGLAASAQTVFPTATQNQVAAAERAFARSMADRNYQAFVRHLSEEAVFFSTPTVSLRGKKAVADGWKPLFEGEKAPFSWEPTTIEVLESGTLALSSGPVKDASGKVTSTFTSIWRLEAPGIWRIIFDKGNNVCDPPK